MSFLAVKHIFLEFSFLILITCTLAYFLSTHLHQIYLGKKNTLERFLIRFLGSNAHPMSAKQYTMALITFSLVVLIFLALVLLYQGLSPALSFNLAISYLTGTNWQPYSPELNVGLMTQMLGFTTVQFVAPAIAFSVLFAVTRGLSAQTEQTVGNFWLDMTRITFYVLIPLAFVFALILGFSGVIQTLTHQIVSTDLSGTSSTLTLGPVASLSSIALLGSNGGGYFAAGWAHPFACPTAFTHFIGIIMMLLLPIAGCFFFGRAINDTRQGIALFAIMSILYLGAVTTILKTQLTSPQIQGTETRFSPGESALWAATTTATSTGATSMDMGQLKPLAQSTSLFMILIGEIAYGGGGSGVLGMLVYVMLAVFISGLMVGRSPEYLGKKITPYDMKLVSIILLVPLIIVLVGVTIMINITAAPHHIDHLLYGLASLTHNNGSSLNISAFTDNGPLILSAGAMLLGRYFFLIPMLILAGSFTLKTPTPPSAGTLPTHIPLFIGIVIGVVLLIGALSYVPAITLGPLLPLAKGG